MPIVPCQAADCSALVLSFIPHMLPTTAAQEAQLLGSLNLSPPYTSSIPSGSPLRALLVETTSALSSVDFGYALDGSLACAFGALGVHLSQKGLLGGEVVGGDGGGGASGPVAAEEQPPVLPRAKGRKLAEVLVEVSRWGRDCLTADQGGLGRNDIIDVRLSLCFQSPNRGRVTCRLTRRSPTLPHLPSLGLLVRPNPELSRASGPWRIFSDHLLSVRRPA